MEPLLQQARRLLYEDEWKFTCDEDRGVILAGVRGENTHYNCMFVATESPRRLTFYSHIGNEVPEIKRHRMCEFLTRANYGLVLGNFEMDMSDGEMRFRTSMDLADANLTHKQLMTLIWVNLFTFDRYYQGIMRVMYSNTSAAEAVAECERATH